MVSLAAPNEGVMYDSFNNIAFALQVIAFLLALIFLALTGMGVLFAPAVLSRFDELLVVLRRIADK